MFCSRRRGHDPLHPVLIKEADGNAARRCHVEAFVWLASVSNGVSGGRFIARYWADEAFRNDIDPSQYLVSNMQLQLGDLEIHGITEIEQFDVPLDFMFPEIVTLLRENDSLVSIDPSVLSYGQVHLTIRSWLLRKDDRVILIDGCVGNHKTRQHWPSWHQRDDDAWPQRLASLGVRPEDVDIVMCTHLHADHVGWNTRLENGIWVPTFPNATYLTGRVEYEYWLADSVAGDKHGSFADSVMPVVEAGQLVFLEDGSDIAHGLSVELAPGHTPGQLCSMRG